MNEIPKGLNTGLPRLDPMYIQGFCAAMRASYSLVKSFGEQSSIKSKKQLRNASEGLLRAILVDGEVRDLYMTYGGDADWRDIGLTYNPKTGTYYKRGVEL